ncbi:MAG TPA: GNAT family N-acetyltransferase [Acidimicrobiia bacterium]|nr:GNAT family N-acetyltransferase [Acidimicrobiia bacterium]
MFSPIETERLIIRAMASEDATALQRRRNTPEVAVFQDWAVPSTLEDARDVVASMSAMDGPEEDEWWMATVAESASGDVVGDLAVRLTRQGRTAEIGYNLDPEHWGHGYAVESVRALLGWLFEVVAVSRVEAHLHPENRASAMVLERNGFLWEGETRLSHWVGDEVSDDWIYGLVRSDWVAWNGRPTDPPAEVSLVAVEPANGRDVLALKTHKTQEEFVAPMGPSFADALFPEFVDGAPLVPWTRVVVADGEYAGFVMLALSTEHHSEPYLWRLLIDRMHQRRGIGGRVLDLVAEHCRESGDTTLVTSWVEGKGSPAPFYLSHGFVPTGRIVDGETEARKSLV